MSQEDEKCEQQQPEPQELPDRDVIVRLSERFEIFTQQVLSKMDELLSMRETVEKLLQRKSVKRQQDAERKRQQRAVASRVQVGGDRLPLNEKHEIFKPRMAEMHEKYITWAHIGIQFGVVGNVQDWLSYIASDWNHWTFEVKPITRVSNRPHYFSRGIRSEATWTDVFGRETGIAERTFSEPIFWDFYHIMYKVLLMMEEMPDFDNVQDSFRAHVQLACSGVACMTKSGMYQYFDKTPFDHLEPECAKVPQYRLMATRVMQAFRKGIAKKAIADPREDKELVRMGKARAQDHLRQLRNEANKLIFMHNLRKGQLLPDEKQQVEALDVWGFVPKFEKFPKIV